MSESSYEGDPYDLAGDADPTPGERAVSVRLSDVTPERVRWVWADRLPVGKLVVLDGDPSLGKSTITLDWAARVSTGTDWPDGAPCEPADVIILSAEDGLADTIRPRLDAAGADPTRVHALTAIRIPDEEGGETTRPPTLADVTTIGELVQRVAARLLVVDVLMAYLPTRTDSHRDQDVRAVLHRVAEMAEQHRCCVVLLRHLRKQSGGSPLYAGGGSIGIIGAARAGFVVAPDPDDPSGATRVLAATKSNLAATPASLAYRLTPADGSHVARVQWLGDSAHAAAALLAEPEHESADESTACGEAQEWLLAYLKENNNAAPAATVIKAAARDGITRSRSALDRARRRAKITTTKRGIKEGWTWCHPDWEPPEELTCNLHSDQGRTRRTQHLTGAGAFDQEPEEPSTPENVSSSGSSQVTPKIAGEFLGSTHNGHTQSQERPLAAAEDLIRDHLGGRPVDDER